MSCINLSAYVRTSKTITKKSKWATYPTKARVRGNRFSEARCWNTPKISHCTSLGQDVSWLGFVSVMVVVRCPFSVIVVVFVVVVVVVAVVAAVVVSSVSVAVLSAS